MSYLDDIQEQIQRNAVTSGSVSEVFDQYDVEVAGDEVRKAALLHNYFYYYVDFEWRDDRDLRSVPETIEIGGNCEEQTIALAGYRR
ncbi:hypothetical protein [Halobellus rarus]|uniref:Uncharacterized protein n=1 Tax=Halobellus rarus TaxID=1126237 RepID=A0ABD6CI86_9EURY|nr:hypothetical protein [Halobellus rarus]